MNIASEKKPAAKVTPVRLLRDYWPKDNVRVTAGEEIEVSIATAKELVSNGVAERADAFPGE